MNYDTMLDAQFKDLIINLVAHDTSPCGLPCYIEVLLGKAPKDKGALVLDLGNYIYRRFGLRYQMCPELRGRGKTTSIRWFMTWDDVQPIRANILKACDKPEGMLSHREYLPLEFRSLIIQNTARGVCPRQQEDS